MVIGFSFYSRLFTIANVDYHNPNTSYQFLTARRSGNYSNIAGILNYIEI